jgi:hypothetical protein
MEIMILTSRNAYYNVLYFCDLVLTPLSFFVIQLTSSEISLVPRCRRIYAHAHDYHINSISNNRCIHLFHRCTTLIFTYYVFNIPCHFDHSYHFLLIEFFDLVKTCDIEEQCILSLLSKKWFCIILIFWIVILLSIIRANLKWMGALGQIGPFKIFKNFFFNACLTSGALGNLNFVLGAFC